MLDVHRLLKASGISKIWSRRRSWNFKYLWCRSWNHMVCLLISSKFSLIEQRFLDCRKATCTLSGSFTAHKGEICRSLVKSSKPQVFSGCSESIRRTHPLPRTALNSVCFDIGVLGYRTVHHITACRLYAHARGSTRDDLVLEAPILLDARSSWNVFVLGSCPGHWTG